MGKSCCEDKSAELVQLRKNQGKVLIFVLMVNFVMFFVEFSSGIISKSMALTADSLDMLGDALVYGFSLYVLNKADIWRARAGFFKGLLMLGLGVFVLGQAVYKFLMQTVPDAHTMGAIAALALFANGLCVIVLYRHRSDDINMRSTWLCSRNDIIANTGVILAGYLVFVTGSQYPDFIVGSIIAFLFLRSSIQVLGEARAEISLASKSPQTL